VFRIELLPAAQGDSIWIEYGPKRKPRRVLIDGGTAPTYDHIRARVLQVPEDQRRFDHLIVTHVDSDHIQGIVRLLQDASLGLDFADVWFNGWKHLPTDLLGPAEGEMLSALIRKRRPRRSKGLPWNRAFHGGPVQVAEDDREPLPQVELDGGMNMTLLSPTRAELRALAPVWADAVRAANLDSGNAKQALDLLGRRKQLRPDALGPGIDVEAEAAKPFSSDGTRPNGSSIVVLAAFDGISCMLAGDAHAPVLEKTIPRLTPAARPTLDAFKLPHHGSQNNVSTPLLEALPARRYLFSSNGAIYHHPDVEAVARVLVCSSDEKELIFNYSTVHNQMWSDSRLIAGYEATARFPDRSGPGMGIAVDL
jgi:beta-lactamase superfamily II metal-dependent hydrolase